MRYSIESALVFLLVAAAACSDSETPSGGELPPSPVDAGALDAAIGDVPSSDVGPPVDPCAPGPDGIGEEPPPRSGAWTIFDAPRNRLWMMGGDLRSNRPAGEDPRFTNEVWVLERCPWRWRALEFVGQGMPRPRGGHAIAHDPESERLWVLGGRHRHDFSGVDVPPPDRSFEMLSDVFAYDLSTDTWQRVAARDDPAAAAEMRVGNPWPRHGHSAVYDPAGSRIILFGGTNGPAHVGHCVTPPCEDTLLLDTWQLDLSEDPPVWREMLFETAGPPRRQDHAAALDPDTGRMFVTGGSYGPGFYMNDLWALELGAEFPSWTELAPAGGTLTPPRAYASLHYDPDARTLVMFGGLGQTGFHNDVLVLDLVRILWARLIDTDRFAEDRPSPRGEAGVAYLGENRFVVLGGETPTGPTIAPWSFDMETKTWSPFLGLP